MKKIVLSLTLILVVILMACDNSNLKGTYCGKLPAADGSGISYKLTIEPNKKYTLVRRYVGQKDGVFTNKGSWTFSNQVITLEGISESNRYLVKDENRIAVLDLEGKEITGELANAYILKKCTEESCDMNTKDNCNQKSGTTSNCKDSTM